MTVLLPTLSMDDADMQLLGLTKEAASKQQPEGYLKETEKIKKTRDAAGSKTHKFVAATWTHPNGHPRCLVCGDEEREGGQCEGHKQAEDNKRLFTIKVDLDGTLAKPYKRYEANKIEPPRPGAKRVMTAWKSLGHRVIINTVRGDEKLVAKWLAKHEIPYDYINHNPDQPEGASNKIIADVAVDDCSIDATVSWDRIEKAVAGRKRKRDKVAALTDKLVEMSKIQQKAQVSGSDRTRRLVELLRKKQLKQANSLMLRAINQVNPIYDRGKPLMKNLLGYLRQLYNQGQTNLRTAYNDAGVADSLGPPSAGWDRALKALRGEETVLKNPLDIAAYRYLPSRL